MSERRPYLNWVDPAAEAALRLLAAENAGPAQDPQAWRSEALCAQADAEAWYPEKGGSTTYAKRICRGCPVQEACLQYALDHDERFGVWGATSERDRRRMKRGQRLAVAA